MTARYHVHWFHHATLEVLGFEELAIAFLRRRWSAFARDITALGSNDDFLALPRAASDCLSQRCSDRALRSLAPVIDRGIQQVYTSLECGCDGGSVSGVLVVIALSEV